MKVLDNFKEVYALEGDNGKRLDVVARAGFSQLSLGQVFKAIRIGKIKLNFKQVCPSFRVCNGDSIQYYGQYIEKIESKNLLSFSEEQDFADHISILWENDDLVAINKPFGMLVHGNNKCLDTFIKRKYSENRSLSFNPGPCHRLDCKTTGVILFSKTLKGAHLFAQKQRDQCFIKFYLGIVRGVIKNKINWTNYLQYNDRKVCVNDHGKIAKTQVIPILTKRSYSLVIFRLHETGRKHQIRVQAAYAGYPLISDLKYGGGGKGDYFLHALSFIDKSSSPIFPPLWAFPIPKQEFIEEDLLKKSVKKFKDFVLREKLH